MTICRRTSLPYALIRASLVCLALDGDVVEYVHKSHEVSAKMCEAMTALLRSAVRITAPRTDKMVVRLARQNARAR